MAKWFLVLTRPRFEASAARHVHHYNSDVYYPTKPDPQNPLNKVAAITGYVLVKSQDPDHTPFAGASMLDPCGKVPIPSHELARCTSANPRYLMTYSHSVKSDLYTGHRFRSRTTHEIKDRPFDIYYPHTIADEVVQSLSASLNMKTEEIISSIIGKKVRIPSGLCMGLQAKVKKITYSAMTRRQTKSNDPLCTLRICDANSGILYGTKLVFPLSEL